MLGFTELRLSDLVLEASAFGLFAFATVFFLNAWLSLSNRRYLSLAAISALTGIYSLSGMALKLAFLANAEARTVGSLLVAQSLCIPFFLAAIPFFLSSFIRTPAALMRVNRAGAAAALAFAVVVAAVAVAYPPVYLSSFALGAGGVSYRAGFLYYAAHLPVGVAILYAVALLLADLVRWKNLKDEYFLFIGALVSSFFAVSSVWRLATGRFLDPFPSLRFSRIVVSLIFFGLIISIGFIRRFLGEAAETRKAKERADAALITDALTGLPNRLSFRLDAETDAEAGRDVSVLLIDIDGFLDLNESYGAETGDGILRGVGPALLPLLGDGARLYRMGGDEFAVALPASGEGGPEEISRRVKERLKDGIEAEAGSEFSLDCSIAISTLEDAGGRADAMLANSYSCLREAKRGGNAVLRFSRDWHEGALNRIEMARALRADSGGKAFRLEYQPIHGADGGITGAEALLRWARSDRFGGPAVFIPVAESAGLMPLIGRRVMEILVSDLGSELRAGGLPRLSVNLSPAQFVGPDCCDYVEELFAGAGLGFDAFQFEVTESMFLDRGSPAVASLERLRDRGSLIAIDDFGSGYSNLGYLKSLPVNKIKVDRSFIASIPGNPSAEALVRSLADIGRSFGLELLVEGVETREQFEFLKEAGYREFQGFYFSRPLVPSDFIRYVRGAG
jgi:diguanylate cyclase (GGDEF)-like protein